MLTLFFNRSPKQTKWMVLGIERDYSMAKQFTITGLTNAIQNKSVAPDDKCQSNSSLARPYSKKN